MVCIYPSQSMSTGVLYVELETLLLNSNISHQMPDIGRGCKTARGDLEGAQATAGGRPRHPAGSRRRQHMAAPGRAEGDRHQAAGSRQQRAAASSSRQQQAAIAGGQRPIGKHSQQPRRGHRAQRNPITREPKRTTCSEHF